MRKIIIFLVFSFSLVGCHKGMLHWIVPEPGNMVILPTVTPTPEKPVPPKLEPKIAP